MGQIVLRGLLYRGVFPFWKYFALGGFTTGGLWFGGFHLKVFAGTFFVVELVDINTGVERAFMFSKHSLPHKSENPKKTLPWSTISA